MSVELRPLGVRCNLACSYCYQEPQRAAGNARAPYDLDAMKAAVEREGGPFVLFGGEPLLLPLDDLEHLLAWGHERYGQTGLQTNGVLIGDEHVALFRRYDVHVGVSVDGPGELNALRRKGSAAHTLDATERTLANVARLVAEHRPPGIIVTLHRHNASAGRLGRLVAWVRSLHGLGIRSMRLHLLEVDDAAARAVALTEEENVAALAAFAELAPALPGLRFDVFDDVEEALRGTGSGACTWRGCDPWSTAAVRGVEGDGTSSNCGRTNKDGIDFPKAERPGYERYVALATTPKSDGGCAGCRFLLLCRGQCPGTAVDGDWRNRSEHCGVWTSVFEATERRLVAGGVVPVSLDPRRPAAEERLLAAWRRGSNPGTGEVLADTRPATATHALPDPGYRLVFVGEAQRERWAPVVAAARAATWRVTLAATAGGTAPVAVVTPPRADAMRVREEAVALGLHTRVLDAPGEPLRMAVGARDAVRALAAGAALDDVVAPCCPAATELTPTPGTLARGEPNTLLRGLGIDLAGDTTCRDGCATSLARTAERRAAAAGVEGGDALLAVLSWSAEWTALHGMAEVKTAVFRAVHATAYSPERIRVTFDGEVPDGAARGLSFPYLAPRRALLPLLEGR